MDSMQSPAHGAIRADEVYTLAEVKKRLGLNDEALRQARRRGLRARKCGRRRYYVGRELIDFLLTCPQV